MSTGNHRKEAFRRITPEEAGISSAAVQAFYEYYEAHGLNLHSVIMMRGDRVFSEVHWAPFNDDRIQRMYSVSKSFVSVAIGLLAQDGLLDLDAPITPFFADELAETLPPYLEKQTVRHMLKMNTAITEYSLPAWFYTEDPSRAREYFRAANTKLPGGNFLYDSTGSYLLGVLVEKISGMDFFTFLRKRILDRIGFSKEAKCLKTPDGNAWGDSAILCKPSDLLRFARFVLNGGIWEGERLMNEAYLREATSKQTDNSTAGLCNYNNYGYGYQFWMTFEQSFSMNGMGGQFAIFVPHKDLILVCTADNQGNIYANHCMFNAFFDQIVHGMEDRPLDADPAGFAALQAYSSSRLLSVARGEASGQMAAQISGRSYRMAPNKMGITRMKVTISGEQGVLSYTNAQGDKELPFGMKKNWFGKFPQYGYSDEVGAQSEGDSFLYDCAASAGWVDDKTLQLRVQIIDQYLGILVISLAFCENADGLNVRMTKAAEAFLDEYEGWASGLAES